MPEAARAVAFKLTTPNTVSPELVAADGKYYVVRLNGITPGHKRTLAESDRSIRVVILQQKMADREKALDEELRKKYPVEIDDAALAQVKVPAGIDFDAGTSASRWVPQSPAPSGTASAGPAPERTAPGNTDGGR